MITITITIMIVGGTLSRILFISASGFYDKFFRCACILNVGVGEKEWTHFIFILDCAITMRAFINIKNNRFF